MVICLSHACQGKLYFRGRHFYSSFILAELMLWKIKSKERFGNRQVGWVRPHCHLSFDQPQRLLVQSSPFLELAWIVSTDGLNFSRRSGHTRELTLFCVVPRARQVLSLAFSFFPSNPVRWDVLCPFDVEGRSLKNLRS